MFELVPSQLMRKFFCDVGFEFTDFQKATLIWNAPGKTRKEILDALRELSEITEDKNVTQQIQERIKFEDKIFAAFINNQLSKYVYVVVDSEDGCSCGFFGNYYMAAEYALKYTKENKSKWCSIRKQLIVSTTEDKKVRNHWNGYPNMGIKTEEYSEYNGEAVAEATLNSDGEIKNLTSYEIPKQNEPMCGTGRFEHQFIKIPFDLQAGTPVKDVINGTYGILAQGKEAWNKYLQNIENRKLHVDYSDIQVGVYRLTKTGYWSHEHINPMRLDIEFPPYIQDDKIRDSYRRAMEAFGDYLSHKDRGIVFCPEVVLKYAREYAAVCQDKSQLDKNVEEANVPEDIMW